MKTINLTDLQACAIYKVINHDCIVSETQPSLNGFPLRLQRMKGKLRSLLNIISDSTKVAYDATEEVRKDLIENKYGEGETGNKSVPSDKIEDFSREYALSCEGLDLDSPEDAEKKYNSYIFNKIPKSWLDDVDLIAQQEFALKAIIDEKA